MKVDGGFVSSFVVALDGCGVAVECVVVTLLGGLVEGENLTEDWEEDGDFVGGVNSGGKLYRGGIVKAGVTASDRSVVGLVVILVVCTGDGDGY